MGLADHLRFTVICVSSPHHSGATADSAFRNSRSCVFALCTTLPATRAQRNPVADTMTSSGLTMFTRRQLCTQARFSQRKRTSSTSLSGALVEVQVDAQMSAVQQHDVPTGVAEREPQISKAHVREVEHPCSKYGPAKWFTKPYCFRQESAR